MFSNTIFSFVFGWWILCFAAMHKAPLAGCRSVNTVLGRKIMFIQGSVYSKFAEHKAGKRKRILEFFWMIQRNRKWREECHNRCPRFLFPPNYPIIQVTATSGKSTVLSAHPCTNLRNVFLIWGGINSRHHGNLSLIEKTFDQLFVRYAGSYYWLFPPDLLVCRGPFTFFWPVLIAIEAWPIDVQTGASLCADNNDTALSHSAFEAWSAWKRG